MDKNTGIGLALIAIIVIGFSYLTRPSQEEIERERRYQDSIQNVQARQVHDDIAAADSGLSAPADQSVLSDFLDVPKPQAFNDTTSQRTDSLAPQIANAPAQEQIVSLENSKIKINFSTLGGQIVSVQLKGYKTFEGDSLLLMDNGDVDMSLELMNKKGIRLNTNKANFTPIKYSQDAQTLVMRMKLAEAQHIDFIYALSPDDYNLKFDLAVVGMEEVLSIDGLENFTLKWRQSLRRQEKNAKNEQRYSRLHYRTTDGYFDGLSESNNDKREVTSNTKWVGFKDQYFASVLTANESFRNVNLESRIAESDKYLKEYSAALDFRPVRGENNSLAGKFEFYFVPLDYYMLKGYDDGISDASRLLELDNLIPLGWVLFRWVNKYFVIPLFDLLNSSGMHMGLVILILTLIVKIIISPLTYKSYMSSAKMRVLKPQVEELNEKYPGQEKAMERQKAVMQLYGQAGVNPMSGCVPMLLQMPVLISLFMFFPSAIALRQESFLWATDLSTYDAIFEWNTHIPLLSGWLDNHISLFCILMTATNIIYTKFNMDATNTGQQQMPGMKWMMLLMPLIFFFVLNSFPAGLNYYYFLSTLITVLLTISFRFLINEEKVLAKLEENKKKPKKKGFMARLQEQAEEAQRQQRQQANSKNRQNKGGGKRR